MRLCAVATVATNTLETSSKDGDTPLQALANVCVASVAANAAIGVRASQSLLGEIDLPETMAALTDLVRRATKEADFSHIEGMLVAQAVTLNTLFTHLVQKGLGAEDLDQRDTYMRLALRAQGQCRATFESLAT